MSRFLVCAVAVLGALVLSATQAQAQAQSAPILWVGDTVLNGVTQPGHLNLSSAGTVVSGSYSFFYGDDLASTTSYSYLETDNTSIGDISGGVVTDLNAANDSVINLTGGVIDNLYSYQSGVVHVTGGTLNRLSTVGNGMIDLCGDDLTISSVPDFTDPFGSYFTIHGQLQNSASPFTAYYSVGSGGTLEFNDTPVSTDPPAPVPETSTAFSLGMLLVLGGVFFKVFQKSRRRTRM